MMSAQVTEPGETCHWIERSGANRDFEGHELNHVNWGGLCWFLWIKRICWYSCIRYVLRWHLDSSKLAEIDNSSFDRKRLYTSSFRLIVRLIEQPTSAQEVVRVLLSKVKMSSTRLFFCVYKELYCDWHHSSSERKPIWCACFSVPLDGLDSLLVNFQETFPCVWGMKNLNFCSGLNSSSGLWFPRSSYMCCYSQMAWTHRRFGCWLPLATESRCTYVWFESFFECLVVLEARTYLFSEWFGSVTRAQKASGLLLCFHWEVAAANRPKSL